MSWRAWVRALSVLAALLAAGAGAQETKPKNQFETFADKGDTFVRAGSNQGLKVGMTVTVLGPRIGDTEERRRVGSATVMEVWESLARLAFDGDALKETGPRFVKLEAPQKKSTATATASSGGTAPPPPPKAEEPTGAAFLKGHAELAGAGPIKRIMIYNDSGSGWNNCDVRLPTNLRYKMAKLRGGDHEAIFMHNFVQDGVELDRPIDHVTVKCTEGSGRFNFAL